MEQSITAKSRFRRFLPLLLAFLIPVAILTVIFVFREIYPFGDEMYLRSDMFHQYAAFLKEFQNILKGNKSLLYSWNIGLGSGLSSTYAYYLATPLYWLIAFVPASQITTFMDALVVLKAGLMSATFVYFLNAKFKRQGMTAVPFGILYALCAYMAAYSWNLMWLDCLVLLPLILLGLERLVKEKRVILYTVTLALSAFTNYYITIMICVFLVFYFLYLAICENAKGVGRFFGACGRFALYSILGGLMAAALIIPTIFAMSYTGSMNNTFPSSLYAYQSLLATLSKSAMCAEISMFSGHIPNIYCTVAAFMLVPLYWLNGKIRLRERIGKTILIAIFLFSFTYNIPAFVWQGMHYPNSLPARHSFIYILLILMIAYEALIRIRQSNIVSICLCWLFAAGAIAGLYFLYQDDYGNIISLIISASVLTAYFAVCLILKSGKVRVIILVCVLIVIAGAEGYLNTHFTGYGTTTHSSYYNDNEDITDLLNSIEDDDGFYRVEKTSHRTKNDGAWLDYMSASIFSSATNDGIRHFYDAFGLQASLNSISYYGHTPLVNAIFGVEYEISKTELDDPTMSLIKNNDGTRLYKSDYALSIGYLVKSSAEENFDMESENPFEVQNSFAKATADSEDIFTLINTPTEGATKIRVMDSGRAFLYFSENLSSVTVKILRGGNAVFAENYELDHRYILDIGQVEEKDIIIISSDEEDLSEVLTYAALINYNALDRWYNDISGSQLEISEFTDTCVRGTVTVDEGSVLLTSIPYDRGWSVYVDGAEVEASSFKDAFISLNLTSGEHTIEFKYFPEGLMLGVIISGIALFIFIISCILNAVLKRRKKEPEETHERKVDTDAVRIAMEAARLRQKNKLNS